MAVVLVVNLNDSVAESVKCTDNEVHYPDGEAEQKRKHVHDCAAGADHYFLHSQNVISLFNFFSRHHLGWFSIRGSFLRERLRFPVCILDMFWHPDFRLLLSGVSECLLGISRQPSCVLQQVRTAARTTYYLSQEEAIKNKRELNSSFSFRSSSMYCNQFTILLP